MARLEVAPAHTSVTVIPSKIMTCRVCKRDIMAEIHLRVADDFELNALALDNKPGAAVDMQAIGVRVAHDCVPGPNR